MVANWLDARNMMWYTYKSLSSPRFTPNKAVELVMMSVAETFVNKMEKILPIYR